MALAEQSVAIRDQLLERMSNARALSDGLFKIVRSEAIYERPIPERHRLIFYLGHLESFDWNLMRDSVLGAKSFHPEFDRLFAFGIDPVGCGLPADQPSDWPSVAAVRDYANRIRRTLDEGLRRQIFEERLQTQGASLDLLLNVAIEHRLMHLETLAYMLHQLPFDKKIGETSAPTVATSPVSHHMIEIPAGVASLGLSRSGGLFGWDNEYELHSETVPAFEIDEFMVTNRQYLEFVNAGGYELRAHWNDVDWDWKTAHEVSHPIFWEKSGESWAYRSMFQEIPLPMDWPVYVSHAEASAYARWAGKSLPTEAEWHRAAYGNPSGERPYLHPWGNGMPGANLCNADFANWEPMPVNALPTGRSAFGVHGMVGNGWEWTSTPFAPFPGFDPFPFYRGYSADFFDGKHFVMKGGSARTAACMLRPTFRNWFQPHYQYVYAGFRCVNR